MAIQEIDFNDSANFMFHPGIQEFVEKHDLNPDPSTFNFRKIFGTADRSDAIYSEPRVWAGHQMFSPRQAADETPESTELPFIMKPDHKLSILMPRTISVITMREPNSIPLVTVNTLISTGQLV